MLDEGQLKSQPDATLKTLRQDLGYSQEELGRRIGCSFRSVVEWEAGRKMPKFDNAVALARELNISLKTLAKVMGIDISRVPDDVL